MKGSGGAVKLESKTVEKNRRIHMKNLCFKLTTLIPMSQSKVGQQDLLDQAFYYINELKERIEKLKRKKEMRSRGMIGFQKPLVKIRNWGSNLEVNLVCGLRTRLMFNHEVINILAEEGAEVIHFNFNIVGDRILHTIHCQAICTRIGLDPSRIHERLKELYCVDSSRI